MISTDMPDLKPPHRHARHTRRPRISAWPLVAALAVALLALQAAAVISLDMQLRRDQEQMAAFRAQAAADLAGLEAILAKLAGPKPVTQSSVRPVRVGSTASGAGR